mmetsp:Transcript_27270/g.41239  ORF Transcript_27270/g.41239 Transcript_27270/m.41239 type:complete len:149 (+) Transcript_27270:96-542(+)
MSRRYSCWLFALSLALGLAIGLQTSSRRSFLASSSAAAIFGVANQPAGARFILNDETGEYDEVEDEAWQDAWKSRWDKAQSMSTNDVFMAARGAGNTDLKEGEESLASKKRRAMAACRDEKRLSRAGIQDPKECNARVLQGEVDFMLE